VLGSVDFTDEEFVTQFKEASASEELADVFLENGGVPNLSQQVTIFGQTYEGVDVVDAICSAELIGTANVGGYTPPVEDIQIISIVISEYDSK
ncbi:MAG: peptidylprolyl isomerase, partial [Oscillospiraceae bacterium]|nr:peptidylprolyl isomerase [Oscillospiraceae bacterium]